MGVPPARPPSTPPPSRGRDRDEGPQESTRKTDFRLPDKKKDEGELKKKSLFDLAAGDDKMKEISSEIEEGKMSEEAALEKAQGAEATTTVSQIGQLIQKMVDHFQIGKVDGKDFVNIDLSTEANVPDAFSGSNLTLSFYENGLSIRFDNFTTPQQQLEAVTLVEQNKDQLNQMVQALQSKNIQITELNIGDREIALPRVEPLPPPFQPTPPPSMTGEGRPDQERKEPERGEEKR